MPRGARVFFLGNILVLLYCASAAFGQTPEAPRFAAGSELSFHLQSRFRPDTMNEADSLPRGTELRVRLLQPIETAHDGDEVQGELIEPIVYREKTVLHAGATVKILVVLLRSRTHPEGFRYELLATRVEDKQKPFDITASLGTSLADGPATTPGSLPSR